MNSDNALNRWIFRNEFLIQSRSITVNVISKSGTTTETALAFRILKQFMEEKYGENAKNRIIARPSIPGSQKQ